MRIQKCSVKDAEELAIFNKRLLRCCLGTKARFPFGNIWASRKFASR